MEQKRNLKNDWNKNRRDFSIRTNQARQYRKMRQKAMIFLGIITICIWIVMFLIKHFVFGVEWDGLFNDILANILGILPPIIIFNFAYEYITRDSVSEETSAKIAEVLMSDADTIALFDEEPKKQFLIATLNSLVENKQEVDMIYGVMEPYIEQIYNIRKNFEYEIGVKEYRQGDKYSPEKYFKVRENLHFQKIYMGNNRAPSQIRVGFMTDLAELDEKLRSQEYIFRENLSMTPEDIGEIMKMSKEELLRWVAEELHLKVMINGDICSLYSAVMMGNCLSLDFNMPKDFGGSNEMSFGIEFVMPQLRDKMDFLVSISEPTYNPYIKFDYPEDIVDVEMFPFMNDGAEALVKNAQNDMGECKIRLRDKWIYPISGVVFVMKEKNK